MGKSRLARTVVLGAVVALLGIWWLARAYDVESAALLRYLTQSVLMVAGSIAVALAGAALLRALRRRQPRAALLGKRAPLDEQAPLGKQAGAGRAADNPPPEAHPAEDRRRAAVNAAARTAEGRATEDR